MIPSCRLPGVEVVRTLDLEPELLNEGKRQMVTRKYVVTSFDSALYYLPPMKVKVDNRVYESKNLALKVYTMDIDTVNTDSIFGMKPEMAPEFTWEDWKPVVWSLVVLLLIVAALIYMIVRLVKNKPILRRINFRQHLAPHKAAMLKIEKIKEERLVQSEDSKEYYTQLTDALRQYMADNHYPLDADNDLPVKNASICGVEEDFKLPQVLKTSVAADWTLPVHFPAMITVEGIYNKDINAVYARNKTLTVIINFFIVL